MADRAHNACNGADERIYDVAVVGDGLAGRVAVIAFAMHGFATLGFERAREQAARPSGGARRAQPGDTRTTALFQASIRLLERLGVWQRVASEAAPLRALRIVDATRSPLRAPELHFEAREIGLDAFGANVSNSRLAEALKAREREIEAAAEPEAAAEMAALTRVETSGISAVRVCGAHVLLNTREGRTFRARLVVGADGRRSICRRAAGIRAREWRYEQTAIACNFSHTCAHDDTSTEFHRRAGPLTTVPLPGRRSSLVWSERPEEARRLMALDEHAFAAVLAQHLDGLLGEITNIGPRAAFPIAGLHLPRLTAPRIALVGEAAHVLPPIGAQGFNLGLRDIAALLDAVTETPGGTRDPGARAVLAAYERARRLDVWSRTMVVDGLNRALMTAFAPLNLMRGLGLAALALSGPLRRLFMHEGMQPGFALPRLMQEEAYSAADCGQAPRNGGGTLAAQRAHPSPGSRASPV